MVMVITGNLLHPNECVLFSDRKDSIASAPISDAMKDFIMRFDAGVYPELMPEGVETTPVVMHNIPEHLYGGPLLQQLLSDFPDIPIS